MSAPSVPVQPSRASLFAGRYPHCNGVLGLTHANFAWDLHPERHLAQELADDGYTTVLVGVHHESRHAGAAALMRRRGYGRVLPGGRAPVVTANAVGVLGELRRETGPSLLHVGYVEPHRLQGPQEQDFMGFCGDYMQPDRQRGVDIPPYLRDTEGADFGHVGHLFRSKAATPPRLPPVLPVSSAPRAPVRPGASVRGRSLRPPPGWRGGARPGRRVLRDDRRRRLEAAQAVVSTAARFA